MAVKIKAICSECLTMHKANLDFGQENIQCPACGHSLKNLPEAELTLIESTLKSQRTNNIVALVAFGIAILCFLLFVFHQFPQMYYFMDETVREAFKMEAVPEPDGMKETGYPVLAGVALLVTMIFGILGARKRFVVEF